MKMMRSHGHICYGCGKPWKHKQAGKKVPCLVGYWAMCDGCAVTLAHQRGEMG